MAALADVQFAFDYAMAICPFRKFKKEGLARAKTQLDAVRSSFLGELSDLDGAPPNDAAPGSEAFGKGKLHIQPPPPRTSTATSIRGLSF
jgi:hypothetical protein